MMKKVWLILLAVVLVSGLAMLGCKGGGEPTDPNGPRVLFTVELKDNFQYGNGYQGLIDAINKQGNNMVADMGKITEGKDYTIRVSFKASRDFEEDLQVGLVDRNPGSPPSGATWNQYWRWLTSDADADSTMATKEEINAARAADEPVEKIMTFTAIATANGTDGNQNSFAFQTKGEGTQGTASSGTKGPVILSFYDFAFIEGDEEDLPTEPVEPPPGSDVTFDTADGLKGLAVSEAGFISVDTTTGIISRDIHNGSGDYGNYFSVTIPTDQLPIIPSDTIVIKYIGKGNAPLTPKVNTSGGDLNPADYATFTGDDTVKIKEIKAVLYDADIPTSVLWFQGRPNAAAWQLKIISITVVHGDPIKVTTPVAGIRPVATETPKTTDETLQYTAGITWKVTTGGAAVTGAFAESTSYTATIELTAKTGYTFAGIAANTFSVPGATTVTHAAGTTTTLSITAVFPDTKGPAADKVVDFTTANVTGPSNVITGKRAQATVISDVTASEYKVESYGEYDLSYTYFTVTFDEEVVLSDYLKLSFTVEVVSGSITYKSIYVLAYAIDATIPDYLPKTNPEFVIASKTTGNPIGGTGNSNITLDLAVENNLQAGSNSILVAINVPSDNANKAEYKIKNVKFFN